MQPDLLIAIFTGIGAMLGWGFADFFAKKTIDRVGPLVSLVWAHVFGTSFFLLVAAYQVLIIGKPIGIPQTPAAWGGLLFFGALQAIVYLLAYIGFGKGQVAVLNPIFASYAGIAAFASIAFLGETASNFRLLSLLLVFLGILLLSVDFKGLRSKNLNVVPGLKEIALAALLAAFWTLSWDIFIGGRDFVSFALFMYAFMTFTAFVIAKAKKVNLRDVKPGVWKFLALIGLGETIAYLSISWGFSATSLTSIVALISGSFSLPTIILAHLFLKERLGKVQLLGAFTIVAGVILLSALK